MDAPAKRPAGEPAIDRARFEEFLIAEARLLDERRFREWMELFSEDGTYWVPAVPGQASPLDQASLFYDDRDLMRTTERASMSSAPRSSWWSTGTMHSGSSPAASTIGCAATGQASASCRSASTSSIAILPSRRSPSRFDALAY